MAGEFDMELFAAAYTFTVIVAGICTLIECTANRLPAVPNAIVGLLLCLIWPVLLVYCLSVRRAEDPPNTGTAGVGFAAGSRRVG